MVSFCNDCVATNCQSLFARAENAEKRRKVIDSL